MNRNTTAIILIVLAIGIYFTFTQGIIDQAKTELTTNDQYTTAIANAKTLISLRDKVNNQYINIAPSDLDRLNKMLPDSTNNIHLIVDLNNLAQQFNFSLSNLKADAGSPINPDGSSSASPAQSSGPSLSVVRVTFTANASYNDFLNFLSALESNLRVMDISKLTVKANDTNIFEFQVELRTYWLKS